MIDSCGWVRGPFKYFYFDFRKTLPVLLPLFTYKGIGFFFCAFTDLRTALKIIFFPIILKHKTYEKHKIVLVGFFFGY